MRPLPPGLPPASSPKWHSRRLWDPLGYRRVRSLADPARQRDLPEIAARLRREMPPVDDELRPLYEAALYAVARYPRTRAGVVDRDGSWDQVLAGIDDILVRRQRDHLDAVRDAGVSGKDVPPRGSRE